jgi:hypothetical protein
MGKIQVYFYDSCNQYKSSGPVLTVCFVLLHPALFCSFFFVRTSCSFTTTQAAMGDRDQGTGYITQFGLQVEECVVYSDRNAFDLVRSTAMKNPTVKNVYCRSSKAQGSEHIIYIAVHMSQQLCNTNLKKIAKAVAESPDVPPGVRIAFKPDVESGTLYDRKDPRTFRQWEKQGAISTTLQDARAAVFAIPPAGVAVPSLASSDQWQGYIPIATYRKDQNRFWHQAPAVPFPCPQNFSELVERTVLMAAAAAKRVAVVPVAREDLGSGKYADVSFHIFIETKLRPTEPWYKVLHKVLGSCLSTIAPTGWCVTLSRNNSTLVTVQGGRIAWPLVSNKVVLAATFDPPNEANSRLHEWMQEQHALKMAEAFDQQHRGVAPYKAPRDLFEEARAAAGIRAHQDDMAPLISALRKLTLTGALESVQELDGRIADAELSLKERLQQHNSLELEIERLLKCNGNLKKRAQYLKLLNEVGDVQPEIKRLQQRAYDLDKLYDDLHRDNKDKLERVANKQYVEARKDVYDRVMVSLSEYKSRIVTYEELKKAGFSHSAEEAMSNTFFRLAFNDHVDNVQHVSWQRLEAVAAKRGYRVCIQKVADAITDTTSVSTTKNGVDITTTARTDKDYEISDAALNEAYKDNAHRQAVARQKAEKAALKALAGDYSDTDDDTDNYIIDAKNAAAEKADKSTVAAENGATDTDGDVTM